MRRLSAVLVLAAVAGSSSLAWGEFAGAVYQFEQGTVLMGEPGTTYDTPAAAVGAPNRIAGASIGFPGPVTPFNPPFEQSEVVAIGLGGSLTLELATPVSVGGGTQVGIFTTAGLNDPTFSGVAEAVARTFAGTEFAADRTAIVEVASEPGNFVSLGRFVFNAPTQAYANQDSPYDFPAGAVPSDFDKPFTGDLSSFDGLSSAQISALLDGSGGGTWIDVPESIGLDTIRYVRLSDPLWSVLDSGELQTHRTSAYNSSYSKPADLFIDAVNVVPEPAMLSSVVLGLALLHRRRCVVAG